MTICSFDVAQFVRKVKALGREMKEEDLKVMAADEAERLFTEQFAHMGFDEAKTKGMKKMLEEKILLTTVRFIMGEGK